MVMRTLVVVVALGLAAAGCSENVEGTDFRLTGQVTAVRDGSGPPGDLEFEFDGENEGDDEGEPDGAGTMQLRVTAGGDNLGECDLNPSAVAVFWTDQTNFEPAAIVTVDEFPNNLSGREVQVDGQGFGLDEGGDVECSLVAETVRVAGEAPAATSSPGAAVPSPSPSPEPTATATASTTPPPTETDSVPTASPY